VTEDCDGFYGFVFEGKDYPPERVEEATRAVQRHLGSGEIRRVNDALLQRLSEARKGREKASKKELLHDPEISTLVNTLVLVNQAWITTVIAGNIRRRAHLHGYSTEELFSAALTGEGVVGGVTNAILEYDSGGGAVFSTYLTRAIDNALALTPKQRKTIRRIEARTGPLHDHDEEGEGQGWVDRTALPPEAATVNRDLLEVVQSVIPQLPTSHQRRMATWMIDRIRATGELPLAREAAQIQRPRVSRERQIMEATVDNICRQIETDYPQLAEEGINGWEEFKEAFAEQGRTRR
jgi:hypothetical protein